MAGRKPGGPKTGGRTKGTPNKATASVRDVAKEYTPDAIATLVEVMQDKMAPSAARVSAANSILDRAHGKAPQAIEHTGPNGGPVQNVNMTADEFEERARRVVQEI
jgi:hypothetical protein